MSQKPLLNAGSNVGFHSMLASRLGHRVVSLDPSIDALIQGRKLGWIGEAICADVMNLPFKPKSFSGAIFSEVIEEIPDQPSAISQLALCSERIVITTSPVRSDIFYHLSKKVKRVLGPGCFDIAHVAELHSDELLMMLRNAGLSIRKISFNNPFHIWNVAALFPFLRNLELSRLDQLLGWKYVSAGILCVADSPVT